jgi:DNA-binding SARP family transcriptional activator
MDSDGDGVHPPHLPRLLRRLRSLEAPFIEVWGWPGSGRTALLSALLDAEGERAAGLALGELAREDELRQVLAATRAGGVRWLVAAACPEDRLVEISRWLLPGERLVFATDRRVLAAPGIACSVLSPQELLMAPPEAASLRYQLTGTAPDAAASLYAATDGWYKPYRLALEATGGAGLAGTGPEALLEIPAVRSFLRHEVLETLAPKEREILLEAPSDPAAWTAPEPLRALVEAHGLWVDGPEGERPPRLLAAYLERGARRRRATLARAAHAAGEGLAEAGEGPERARGEEPAERQDPARPESPARSPGDRERPLYRLGLLGDPYVQQLAADGSRDLGWRLRRSFLVLAYLASSPGFQAAREDLVEAVWPREGERTIDRNFHPTLSHLRRALEGELRGNVPPPLLFRNGVYRLSPEICWQVDLLDFRDRLERGRAAAEAGDPAPAAAEWEAAWKLYRGPFLQGLYDPWVAVRREACQRLYLDLLRDLGDLYVRLDRAADAMDAYRAVLIEDPLQERIHLAVMRLYAGQGRRELVRRQYDRLCSLLLEELGIEPHKETTEAYHRLMK